MFATLAAAVAQQLAFAVAIDQSPNFGHHLSFSVEDSGTSSLSLASSGNMAIATCLLDFFFLRLPSLPRCRRALLHTSFAFHAMSLHCAAEKVYK